MLSSDTATVTVCRDEVHKDQVPLADLPYLNATTCLFAFVRVPLNLNICVRVCVCLTTMTSASMTSQPVYLLGYCLETFARTRPLCLVNMLRTHLRKFITILPGMQYEHRSRYRWTLRIVTHAST